MKEELINLFDKFDRLGYNKDQVLSALEEYFDKKE